MLFSRVVDGLPGVLVFTLVCEKRVYTYSHNNMYIVYVCVLLKRTISIMWQMLPATREPRTAQYCGINVSTKGRGKMVLNNIVNKLRYKLPTLK